MINKDLEKTAKIYKIEKANLQELFEEKLAQNPTIKDLIQNNPNYEKNSKYKAFIKKFRKELYYNLRKYHKDEELEHRLLKKLQETPTKEKQYTLKQLVESHTSTAERLPYMTELHNFMNKNLPCSRIKNILDIGGGLFPATFPFELFTELESYTYCDKDSSAAETIKELKQINKTVSFEIHNEPVGGARWEDIINNHYDLTLMLKFIPLMARQNKNDIQKLLAIKSEYILLTGNNFSMVKNANIRKREEKILRDYIDLLNAEIIANLEIKTEFGFLVRSN